MHGNKAVVYISGRVRYEEVRLQFKYAHLYIHPQVSEWNEMN